MKIAKSVSEKITFKNDDNQFHSREFSAYREITLPDNLPIEVVRLNEIQLDFELRKQVLTNFLLEGVLTAEQMQNTLNPYKDLMARAQEKADTLINNTL